MRKLPLDYAVDAGPELYEQLGYFWTVLYKDSEMLRHIQEARVLNGLQAYRDIRTIDAAANRYTLEPYRTERRYPLLLDPKSRNQGPVLTIEASKNFKIGPLSTAKPPRLDGITLGAEPLQRGTVTYKIINPPEVADSGLSLNIFDTTTLAWGVDYIILRDTLIIREQFDPVKSPDAPTAVIWAHNAEVDREDARIYMGIPLALSDEDPARLVKVGGALWDILTHGPTPQLLINACTAIFNVDQYDVHICTSRTGTVINQHGKRITDMPGVPLQVSGLKAELVAAGQPVDITYEGEGRYSFPLRGDPDDVRRFWEQVWERAEESGSSLEQLLEPHLTTAPLYKGHVCGKLVPAEFFLYAGLGTNNVVILIENGELNSATSRYCKRLKELLPAGQVYSIIVRNSFISEYQSPIAEAEDLGAQTAIGRTLQVLGTPSGTLRGHARTPVITAINKCG